MTDDPSKREQRRVGSTAVEHGLSLGAGVGVALGAGTVDRGVHRATDPANCASSGASTIISLWQAISHVR